MSERERSELLLPLAAAERSLGDVAQVAACLARDPLSCSQFDEAVHLWTDDAGSDESVVDHVGGHLQQVPLTRVRELAADQLPQVSGQEADTIRNLLNELLPGKDLHESIRCPDQVVDGFVQQVLHFGVCERLIRRHAVRIVGHRVTALCLHVLDPGLVNADGIDGQADMTCVYDLTDEWLDGCKEGGNAGAAVKVDGQVDRQRITIHELSGILDQGSCLLLQHRLEQVQQQVGFPDRDAVGKEVVDARLLDGGEATQ